LDKPAGYCLIKKEKLSYPGIRSQPKKLIFSILFEKLTLQKYTFKEKSTIDKFFHRWGSSSKLTIELLHNL